MNVKRYTSQPAWDRLREERPALLLLLGDNVYADSTEPAIQNAWHLAQRRVPQFAAVERVTPTLAIWDDHDFGANDSDGTLPGKERSLDVFREVWPNPVPGGLDGTPGVFFKQSYGYVDIFMLDTRYHRSPNFDPDDEKKTMLGAAQWAWFEKELRASKARFKLVCSGSTISASFKDCWLLYTRDRNRLVALTRDVGGIVFLTGDIHTALVGRSEPGRAAGYPVYEIVSSGIAVNPSLHFFVTLDVDTTAPDPTITTNVFKCDGQGAVLEKKVRTIRRSELDPTF
jgi:alkaline phosphatase D